MASPTTSPHTAGTSVFHLSIKTSSKSDYPDLTQIDYICDWGGFYAKFESFWQSYIKEHLSFDKELPIEKQIDAICKLLCVTLKVLQANKVFLPLDFRAQLYAEAVGIFALHLVPANTKMGLYDSLFPQIALNPDLQKAIDEYNKQAETEISSTTPFSFSIKQLAAFRALSTKTIRAYRRVTKDPIGLKNPLFDCWINTAMQIILNSKELSAILIWILERRQTSFIATLEEGEKKADYICESIEKDALDAIKGIQHEMRTSTKAISAYTAYPLKVYLSHLANNPDIFSASGARQYDVTEALSFLINPSDIPELVGEKKQVTVTIGERITSEEDGSMVLERSRSSSSREIPHSQAFTTTENKANKICILPSIEASTDFRSLIDAFFAPSEITMYAYPEDDATDKEYLYKGWSSVRFLRPPHHLFIDIKRFEWDAATGTSQKIVSAVKDIPLKLKFARAWTLSEEEDTFNLTSFAVHQGASNQQGHYRTYIRKENGVWLCVNDKIVYAVDEIEIRRVLDTETSYTHLYENTSRPWDEADFFSGLSTELVIPPVSTKEIIDAKEEKREYERLSSMSVEDAYRMAFEEFIASKLFKKMDVANSAEIFFSEEFESWIEDLNSKFSSRKLSCPLIFLYTKFHLACALYLSNIFSKEAFSSIIETLIAQEIPTIELDFIDKVAFQTFALDSLEDKKFSADQKRMTDAKRINDLYTFFKKNLETSPDKLTSDLLPSVIIAQIAALLRDSGYDFSIYTSSILTCFEKEAAEKAKGSGTHGSPTPRKRMRASSSSTIVFTSLESMELQNPDKLASIFATKFQASSAYSIYLENNCSIDVITTWYESNILPLIKSRVILIANISQAALINAIHAITRPLTPHKPGFDLKAEVGFDPMSDRGFAPLISTDRALIHTAIEAEGSKGSRLARLGARLKLAPPSPNNDEQVDYTDLDSLSPSTPIHFAAAILDAIAKTSQSIKEFSLTVSITERLSKEELLRSLVSQIVDQMSLIEGLHEYVVFQSIEEMQKDLVTALSPLLSTFTETDALSFEELSKKVIDELLFRFYFLHDELLSLRSRINFLQVIKAKFLQSSYFKAQDLDIRMLSDELILTWYQNMLLPILSRHKIFPLVSPSLMVGFIKA